MIKDDWPVFIQQVKHVAEQLSVWNVWFPYASNLECLVLLP